MNNLNYPRTDLALEAADTGDNRLPDGVFVEEKTDGSLTLTTVRIDTDEAAKRLGRPIGKYITIEGDFAAAGDAAADALADALGGMLPEGDALIVGLGNRDITPDTVGVDAAEGIIATRHMQGEQLESIGLAGMRSVCVLTPGVMGQTGLEVRDIISSLTGSIPFSFVVVIDALAARSSTRLGRTIQLSNVGISPGSGVFNGRAELSEHSLGVKVFSLGIPTVVDAATLVYDLCPGCEEKIAQNMMVTPRSIDSISRQGAKIISRALNRALQPQLSAEDIDALMS